MKTFLIAKPYDPGRLSDELIAAGVNLGALGTIAGNAAVGGRVLTDDSAVDATVQAVIAAHDGSATATQQTLAATLAASPDPAYVALRAVLLTAVDEINALREWSMSLQAAVAGAATMAAMKTAVAGLSALPDRTAAQAKAAIIAKINSGTAD